MEQKLSPGRIVHYVDNSLAEGKCLAAMVTGVKVLANGTVQPYLSIHNRRSAGTFTVLDAIQHVHNPEVPGTFPPSHSWHWPERV